MSEHPSPRELHEVLRQIDSLFDQALEEGGDEASSVSARQRLAQLVAEHRAAANHYAELLEVHLELEERFGEANSASSTPATTPLEYASPVTSPEKPTSTSILKMKYWREHRAKFAVLALSLTVLFWAGFYFAVLRDGPGSPAGPADTQADFIAQITGERGARWAEGAAPVAVNGTLGSGERIELAAGFLEITFSNAAVVVLEGPAVFVIDTRSGGTLERGRLVARAETDEAHGFSIGTPHALLLDLGTEFGVESFEAAGTSVEVFEGLVEATPLTRGPGGRPPQSVRLSAGQMASLGYQDTAFNLGTEDKRFEFVHELPAEDEPLGAPVIVPVSVTCSVTSEGQHPPEKLIDGSGLMGSGGLSELRHRSAILVDGLEQQRSYWLGVWGEEEPVRLTFDLGSEQALSSVTIWNYASVGSEVVRCATKFRYAISSDGENFTEIAEETLAVESSHDRISTAQVFPLDVTARYVRIEILETAAGDRDVSEVALGEVRFEGKAME